MDPRIFELVQLTARELGDQWTAEPNPDLHWQARLIRTDGALLTVNEQQDDTGRISVNGANPTHDGRRLKLAAHPQLTFRADRGPVALSRDITRKILPGYAEQYERALRDDAARQAVARKTRATLDAVAQRLPFWDVLSLHDELNHISPTGAMLTATTSASGERVKLDFRDLAFAEAAALLDAYARITATD
ncbi:hypothetical protein ACFYUJ_39000 [Streptomyces sp. NPDC004520]|uniref:hypothetical protein n=1 Tax=Streptomyces sp. NPDC004520 TaxID=3364702 RepID=UPI00367C382D